LHTDNAPLLAVDLSTFPRGQQKEKRTKKEKNNNSIIQRTFITQT
jgi:hypothetical protein